MCSYRERKADPTEIQQLDGFTVDYCEQSLMEGLLSAVMLVLGLGLKVLALAKSSRPKFWQTTKFTINFHRLEHCTMTGVNYISRSTFLTYLQWAIEAL